MKLSVSLLLFIVAFSEIISIVAADHTTKCDKYLARPKGTRRCQMDLYWHIQSLCGEDFESSEETNLNTCCCKIGCSNDTIYDFVCPHKKPF